MINFNEPDTQLSLIYQLLICINLFIELFISIYLSILCLNRRMRSFEHDLFNVVDTILEHLGERPKVTTEQFITTNKSAISSTDCADLSFDAFHKSTTSAPPDMDTPA